MVAEGKVVATALTVFVIGTAVVILIGRNKATAGATGFLTSNERVLASRLRSGRYPSAFPRAF